MPEPKLHTMILTSAQMDAVRDGLELVKERIEWGVANLHGVNRAKADALRDSASAARHVVTEHLYSTGGVAPACERMGCPHLLAHQAMSDDGPPDEYALPPQELLVSRCVDLVDAVDKIAGMAKWLTQDAAVDPTHLTGKPAPDADHAENAELIQRMGGSVGSGDRVNIVRMMDLLAVRQTAGAVRSALRMLHRSQAAPSATSPHD